MPGECPAASRTAGLPPGAQAFLDQLAEFIEDFIAVNQLSTFRLGCASFELDLKLLKILVLVLSPVAPGAEEPIEPLRWWFGIGQTSLGL